MSYLFLLKIFLENTCLFGGEVLHLHRFWDLPDYKSKNSATDSSELARCR